MGPLTVKQPPRPMPWKEWFLFMLTNNWPSFIGTDDAPAIVASHPREERHVDSMQVGMWGTECTRGFVRDDRFGSGRVIKGTNRSKTKSNRHAVDYGSAR